MSQSEDQSDAHELNRQAVEQELQRYESDGLQATAAPCERVFSSSKETRSRDTKPSPDAITVHCQGILASRGSSAIHATSTSHSSHRISNGDNLLYLSVSNGE